MNTTKPARTLVHARLSDQTDLLVQHADTARAGGDGGIHGVRRAARRLRALLATYRPLLEREHTDPVRDELRWLARSLGAARDQEVVAARLEELVEATDPTLVVGPVRRRIAGQLDAHGSEDAVREVLDSERFAALQTSLAALVAGPPWTARADKRADKVLPALVRQEWKRLRRLHADGGEPHEVRKAVKRMRYAYEVLEPAWGKEARKPRRAAQQLMRILGERQDSVVARATLLELSRRAGAFGENAFTYGLLYAEQQALEPELLAEADVAWTRLAKLSW